MFRVQFVSNPQNWETFVQSQLYTLFVQSYRYGEFYASMGEKYWIIGIYDGEDLVGGALTVSTHAKRGNFLYIPYGPILPQNSQEEALRGFTSFATKLAKENNLHFIRVSPFIEEKEGRGLYQKQGFKNAPIHVLAETTWLLDITNLENKLLADMNKNHRNLIRRCERDGVRIVMDTSQEALDDLHKLLDTTAKRHHFTRFSRSYIDKEFAAFAQSGNAVVFRAYLPDGQLDSVAVIMFYGSMACYRHSGSLNLDNRLPTSYLVQWRVIEEAKKRGMKWYNFWGVAPEGADKSHPFHGITHFKKGFGGAQRDVLTCQDLPLQPRYYITWIIETLRRIKRGF